MGGRRNRIRSGRNASDRNAEQFISDSSGTLKLNSYLQIKQSDEIGRYLIASEDLFPGTILLQEYPIVIGPNFGLGPTCLRCGKMIHSRKNPISRCEHCEWPVCDDGCQGVNFNLHSAAECEILTKAAKKPQLPTDNLSFNIITPLRVLLTRRNDPEKWAEIQKLESHDDIRRLNQDQWNFYQREVVDAFKEVCSFQEFTEDEVHTVCGYLQVNSFSVERTNMRGIYPRIYLLAHDCVPNTSHVFASDHKITLRSTTLIRKGEMVTLSYADTLQGTMQRRASLKESKYFECRCERCKDPTELGTNFSSLRCQKCCKGFLQPQNSLDADSPWRCRNSRCGSTTKSTDVLSVTQKVRNEMDKIRDGDITLWEDFLRKQASLFHPSHNILTTVKISLSQMYGKVQNYIIDEMSLEQLQRKISLCQDVLKVTDVFEPGLSRIRGVTLYELHAPLLLYAITTFQSGSSNKELLKRRLGEVVSCLEEAGRILSYEDPSSAEGKILSTIESALRETKTWETQLKNIR